MFVELIDLLRCPREHEDSWLVLAAGRTTGRHVMEGTLGCPVCGAEYTLHDGIADLRDGTASALSDPVAPGTEPSNHPTANELATMLAAYANLSDAGGCAAISGSLLQAARTIEELTGVSVMLVNPPPSQPPGLSGIRCEGTLPLSRDGLRALVLDKVDVSALHLPMACSRVRPGGRVVLPPDAVLPTDVLELARDAEWLVAERTPPRVELRRA